MTHGVGKSVENDAFPSRVPSGRGFRFTRRAGLQAISIVAMGALVSVFASAQVNVTTYHNDIGRTGQNLNETVLTTSNVNATQFGKLFSQSVDGQVYAQPLYLSGITVNGATHNVVFVATENDSVYAFDADSNGGTNSGPLWKASMLLAAHGAAAGATTIPSSLVSTDIQPQVGITGTPVIDPVSGTLYVVSAALEGGSAVQRLHALDVSSGAEKFGGPVVIAASVPGTGNGSVSGKLTFESLYENQRPGLLLLNGIVYIGFASHGDNGPWHGWILGYNATTLAQTGAYCPSPNGTGSGFWMSGGGLAADQLNPATQPYGRMFVPTGNGDYNATKPYTNSMDFGDTDLNLNLANGAPTVTDEFTPYLQAQDDAEDGDVASGGLVVLPTQTTGSVPNLAVQSGKNGWIYLLNRDNMGGYSTSTDNIVQEIGFAVGQTGVWSSPAYWNGNIYYWGVYDNLKSFALTNGKLATTPTKSAEQYGFPGSTPSISANGATQGILWSIDSEAYGEGPAILQAHNASSVGTTLYSSTTNATRDTAGGAVKFAVPTVVNGKVYVGAASEVDVYGLLAGASQTSAPTFTPGTESFAGSVTVSLADSTPNSNIYYTTDGSAATTSSTLYSVPIALTSTETINAIATATGLLTSPQSTATYTNTSQANAVTFSLPTGTYTSAQTLTLSDVTANAAIHYTTNGTTPTASSTLYSGPIAINATETVTAVAIAPGVSNSPIISQTYTIAIGATGINFGQGFASSSGSVILNGSTQLNDTRLQLTDGLANEAGSAWYKTPVNIQAFTNNFNFQLSNPAANGITFTIQNASQGAAALGGSGSNLGYAPITNSVALKFDFTTPVGSGTDSTGVYENGAVPTTPAIDLSGTGINLASDDEMAVQMIYNGTTLTVTITDLITSATWSSSAAINIPSVIGSNTAYVGFTGSTSASASSQKILTWSFVSSATLSAVAMPAFAPLAGSYTSAQSVTISDSTANATIYYTTNGSTPTTSSAIYSGPVAVGASETLNAIAVASGFSNSAVATAAYTITQPAAMPTPTFSVAAGTYTSAQSVTISDTTAGAKIYYTTNGTTPTTSSTLYSGAISVGASETLSAIAVATGFSNSAVASAAYTITLPAATPTFSVAAGVYTSAQSVTISDTTTGAKIYYTTNGTTPTTSSTLYSGAISVSASETLSAIAVAAGFSNSAVASAAYQIGAPPAATPVFSVAGGTYTSQPTVTISDTTPGAVIYYTLNGTSPSNKSSLYTKALTIGGSVTLQAIAYATGATQSSIASATYTLNVAAPVFNPPSGVYPGPLTFTVSLATPTAKLYDAVNSDTFVAYTGPITITATSKVYAVGQETGFTQSPLVQAVYTIEPAATTPVFSVAAGTYASAQTVTISDATTGAKIYYTTNGTTPTTSSTLYSGAITVSATETLKAIAVATGFSNSAVGTAAYTINLATPAVNFASGFTSTNLSLMNGATITSGALQLTDGGQTETRNAWFTTPVNVQAFTTDFNFQATSATADGFTFAIQKSSGGINALGNGGASLGYGGIGSSVAIKFDLYNNAGEGADSTGFYTNGAMPTIPAVDMTSSGVNLHSGDVMHAHITYNGTTLTLTLTDTVTNASFTTSGAINIPSVVGGTTAYAGFTGGTGSNSSIQKILSWTYTAN